MKKYRNALVLGGGGAKGFAHLGAITVLERKKLRPDIICGTSAGSLAGAFYAMYAERITELENIERTREFRILERLKMETVEFEKDTQGFFMKTISTVKKKLLLVKILRDNALVREEDTIPVFTELFGDMKFEDLPFPLVVAAFDLVSGKDIYIKSGLLWKGILASCSIPGIFPPVEHNGMLLVDGGVTNRLPVKCAVVSGAQNVIAIDLSSPLTPAREMNSVVNMHLRTDEILASRFDLYNINMADLVIKTGLEDMRWSDFSKYRHAIDTGKEIARENLAGIRKVMSRTYGYRKKARKLLGFDTVAARIPPEEYLIL